MAKAKRRFVIVLAALLLQIFSIPFGGVLAEGGNVVSNVLGLHGGGYHFVQFVDHDGREIASQFIQSGTAAALPQNPTREGTGSIDYHFVRWESAHAEILPDEIRDDVVFTAVYQLAEKLSFSESDGMEAKSPDLMFPLRNALYLLAGNSAVGQGVPSTIKGFTLFILAVVRS